ncbi:MAG: hypothetical protein OHK0022_59170 [Roseiflexaceae bacterium]
MPRVYTRMSTILVVDDDATMRSLFKLMLESAGYQVLSAGTAQDALDLLRSLEELPALILLDLMMPEMTGWDFRELQLEDPVLADIPVVVLSAMNDLPARASDLGISEAIQKPTPFAELLAVVARYCPAPHG